MFLENLQNYGRIEKFSFTNFLRTIVIQLYIVVISTLFIIKPNFYLSLMFMYVLLHNIFHF